MGVDLERTERTYGEVCKTNIEPSDAPSRSPSSTQDGEKSDIASPPPQPAQKEDATEAAAAPPQPDEEGNAAMAASNSSSTDEKRHTLPQSDKLMTINELIFRKVLPPWVKKESALPPEKQCVFPFFLPIDLCGKLIGKNGWSRKAIKDKTKVDVAVLKEVSLIDGEECQLVHLIGPERTMKEAIQMVRSRFPKKAYPEVRLDIARQPIVPNEISLPMTQVLIQISCITNPSLIYVKQPEHWSYCSHFSFQHKMTAHYQENVSPEVKDPLPGDMYVALGPICHRVLVLEVPNEGEVLVKYLDLGGLYLIPKNCLRLIKDEFLTMSPFQATECAMAGIYENGPGWSNAAYCYLLSWAQQIIYGIVTYEGSIPYIQLYGKLPNGGVVSINEEMMRMTDLPQVGNGVFVPQVLPQEAFGGEAAQLPVQETQTSAGETELEATEEGQAIEAPETSNEGAETSEGTLEEGVEVTELDEGQDPATTASTGP